MYQRTQEWKAEFRNLALKEDFYKYILHNVKKNLYCKFSFIDPKSLTPEDVEDIENALELELGETFVVEPKRKLTHISPDGYREYNRRKNKAKRLWGWSSWPDDWYYEVGRIEEDYGTPREWWEDDYGSEDAFWESNGI